MDPDEAVTSAPTTPVPATATPTTVAPTTVAPTIVSPTTVAPTTVAPTTVAPTTVAPTTIAPTPTPTRTPTPTPTMPSTPTPTPTPTSTPTPTPTPTPTMEPWFPIYDPFIFGDNCNYEVQDTCYEDIIPDIDVLKRYLAVRDAFPKKALKFTRVIALSGVNVEAVNLIRESLSKQEKNPVNVDMYFYSDSKLGHRIDGNLALSLISLSAFTYPKQIVFGIGDIKREGMATILQWMVDNKESGYFRNLERFEISGHKIASYDGTEDDGDALKYEISYYLGVICNDNANFPMLTTLSFDFNGYSSSDDSFATALVNAYGTKSVYAEEYVVYYTSMCSDTSGSLWYYDMYSEQDKAQCRFTWNWEVNEPGVVYSPDGPFPNVNTVHCSGATTQPPTTQPPTTQPPTTQPPTTQPPTTQSPTTQPPSTIFPPLPPSDTVTISSPTGTPATSEEDLSAILEAAVRGFSDEEKADVTTLKLYNNMVDFTTLAEGPISLKTVLQNLGMSNVTKLYLYCDDSDTCADAFEDFYDFDDAHIFESGSRRLMDDYSPTSTLHKRYGNLRK